MQHHTDARQLPAWWVANADTGEVVHHHPMFSSWAEQVEWFARNTGPERVNYTAVDSSGMVAFCGRRGDPSQPEWIIEMQAPLVVVCPARRPERIC